MLIKIIEIHEENGKVNVTVESQNGNLRGVWKAKDVILNEKYMVDVEVCDILKVGKELILAEQEEKMKNEKGFNSFTGTILSVEEEDSILVLDVYGSIVAVETENNIFKTDDHIKVTSKEIEFYPFN